MSFDLSYKRISQFSSLHHLIGCLLLALVVYGNSLSNQYALDDKAVITKNTFVKKGIKGIPDIFTSTYWAGYQNVHKINSSYRPIPLAFNAIEFQFFGHSASVSHFINVLLHAINCFLVFLMVGSIKSRYKWLPYIVAGIFLCHPIHTEVVANIKGRDDLLAFMFLMGSLITITKYLKTSQKKYFILSLLFMVVSLLSKESSIFGFGVICLVILKYHKWNLKTSIRPILPFALIGGLYLTLRAVAFGNLTLQQVDPIDNPIVQLESVSGRILEIFSVFGLMIKKMLFPYPLVSDYSYAAIGPLGGFHANTVIGLLGAGGMIWLFFKSKYSSMKYFYSLFFLMSILLVSHILFPYVNYFAERSLYTPSMPFIALSAVVIIEAVNNYKDKVGSIKSQQLLRWILVSIFIVYSFMTIQRNPDWKNDKTLFESDIQSAPNSVRLNILYADLLIDESISNASNRDQLLKKAEALINTSLSIAENVEMNYLVKGNIHKVRGEYNKAIVQYNKYLEHGGGSNAAVHFNLGYVKQSQGKLSAAEEHYQRSIELHPNYTRAFINLGILYGMKNDIPKSIEFLEKAVRMDPSNENAKKNLAKARSLQK